MIEGSLARLNRGGLDRRLAGIIDEDVRGAPLLGHFIEEAVAIRPGGRIEGVRRCSFVSGIDLAGESLAALELPARYCYACSGVGQAANYRAADPPAPTGHDSDAT